MVETAMHPGYSIRFFPPGKDFHASGRGDWYADGMKRLRQIVAAGLVACFAVGCATVPETGRKQFNLISAQQEMQLGYSAFEQMKQEVPVSRDPEANALVNRVGQRISAVADLPNAQWEFVVFESEEANAFCLPGGKVGIYTGILPITKTEAGLATVMGHEVAHAVARHGAERMSEALLIQAGAVGLAVGLGDEDPETLGLAMAAYGAGATLGIALPHSRKHESEADYIGLKYMARAGYDPEEAVAFWERFAAYNKEKGGQGLWFLRTHPLDETRIQRIRSWVPEARQEYRPAP